MAHTYKIKPLQWEEYQDEKSHYFRNRTFDYVAYLDADGDWSVILDCGKIEWFPSKEEAVVWAEEEHTKKAKKYLEALE